MRLWAIAVCLVLCGCHSRSEESVSAPPETPHRIPPETYAYYVEAARRSKLPCRITFGHGLGGILRAEIFGADLSNDFNDLTEKAGFVIQVNGGAEALPTSEGDQLLVMIDRAVALHVPADPSKLIHDVPIPRYATSVEFLAVILDQGGTALTSTGVASLTQFATTLPQMGNGSTMQQSVSGEPTLKGGVLHQDEGGADPAHSLYTDLGQKHDDGIDHAKSRPPSPEQVQRLLREGWSPGAPYDDMAAERPVLGVGPPDTPPTLTDDQIQDICADQSMTPRNVPIKLVDATMLWEELDVLETRLYELWPYVDVFVVVESTRTQSNLAKPLWFDRFRSSFDPQLISKVVYHRDLEPPTEFGVCDDGAGYHCWGGHQRREIHHRDTVAAVVANLSLSDDDVVIFSDMDELPSRAAARALKFCKPTASPLRLLLHSHYYSFNWEWLHVGDSDPHFWTFPLVIPVSATRNYTGTALRFGALEDTQQMLYLGGWHMSYFGTPETARRKLIAYTHQETNIPKYRNIAWIKNCFLKGHDLFGRTLSVHPHPSPRVPVRARESESESGE